MDTMTKVSENLFEIDYRQRNFENIMSTMLVVSSILVDGLALWGARTSAGTVMTKFESY